MAVIYCRNSDHNHLISVHDPCEFRLPEPQCFFQRHAYAFEEESVLLPAPVSEVVVQTKRRMQLLHTRRKWRLRQLQTEDTGGPSVPVWEINLTAYLPSVRPIENQPVPDLNPGHRRSSASTAQQALWLRKCHQKSKPCIAGAQYVEKQWLKTALIETWPLSPTQAHGWWLPVWFLLTKTKTVKNEKITNSLMKTKTKTKKRWN